MSKIYVVDDDRDIVESITMVLESEGHEVASQFDDVDVGKRTAKFGADLVLLDVMFPEDESAGFKMARTLRHNQATKDIPILMLSAINAKGYYAGTFSNRDRDDSYLPVNEFVEKPIQPADLIKKVNALLKGKKK
jgi:CheY-like chemotaxis protein